MDKAHTIPAATLVLMRPAPGGPELLMMERTSHMAFAAGALVFPGGRVDAQDRDFAAALGLEPEEGAARLAAIRETIEETGIPVGLDPQPPATVAGDLRARLLAGEPLRELLGRIGAQARPDALIPFARWCPNFRETRNFDTRFYLAEAPADVPDPTPEPGEAVRAFWASARQVLADVGAGRAHAIFPTRRNLERLARYTSFEEAAEDARRIGVRKVTPWVEPREGEDWLCIPDDLGYPVTAEPMRLVSRG